MVCVVGVGGLCFEIGVVAGCLVLFACCLRF